MALLKGIYMTEVEWYNGTGWVDLKVVNLDDSTDSLNAYTGTSSWRSVIRLRRHQMLWK